jgi:hypothetical protein
VFVTAFVAFVAIPIVGIGDDGVELMFGAGFKVSLAVVVGIGEEFHSFVEVLTESGGFGLGGGLFEEFAEDSSVLSGAARCGGGLWWGRLLIRVSVEAPEDTERRTLLESDLPVKSAVFDGCICSDAAHPGPWPPASSRILPG